MVKLPFSTLDVSTRNLPTRYPKDPQTLGEHLLKRQLDLQMSRDTMAEYLGVNEHTISQWVVGADTPRIPYMKKVIDFIGYYPFPEPKTLGERIVRYRRINGLNQTELANLIGFNVCTVSAWEKGGSKIWPKTVNKIEKFMQGSC